MSTFPVPDYLAENAARLEKMSKEFGATLPKDMAAAINLMSHPAAGVAAMTALGFGLAGQAFGIWAGAVAGAVETSQRLLAQLTPEASGPSPRRHGSRRRPSTNIARPKPVLKVVARPSLRRRLSPSRSRSPSSWPRPNPRRRSSPSPSRPPGRCEGRARPKAAAKAEPAGSWSPRPSPPSRRRPRQNRRRQAVAKTAPAKAVEARSTKPVPPSLRPRSLRPA